MKRILLSLGLSIFAVLGANSQNFYIQEDFNGASLPTGWTNNALSGTQTWSFGLDGSATDPGNNNIDGTAMAYFDDDALGGGSLNNSVELISPVYNNSGIPNTFLEFDYNLRTFNGITDSLTVDVFDGTSWNRVFSLGVDDCGRWTFPGCVNNFPRARIDISSYVSNSARVRFRYTDGNDWAWYVGIDNVDIYSPLPTDLGVSEVIRPISGCGYTNEAVEVKVKNFGFNSVSSFDVTFNVNNGAQTVTETVNTAIPGGDSLNYTFTGLANLTVTGSYDIQAYTTLTGDGAAFNDSATTSIVSEPVYTLTYTEGFETPNHNWKISGQRSSWQRGVPANTFISSAAGGQNAFVTNLTGDYNANELSYLTSPCLDFSASTFDPILSFNLIHRLESGNFDVLYMEYSTDNGATWARLPASAAFAPQNWYNNTAGQTWVGSNSGWVAAENTLDGLATESQVKLRFVMDSDGSSNFEGAGIDNIAIRNRQPKDFSLNEIEYPTSAGSPLCGYATENIIVRYENKGSTSIDTIIFGYQVDGGPIFRDTVITNVGPGQILSHTFTDKYNFSAVRTYQLRAWGGISGDSFNINDSSAFITVSNGAAVGAVSLPYTQNFDQMVVGAPFTQGWTSVPVSTGSTFTHMWNVGTGGTYAGRQGTMTSSFNTGPDEDCSGSGNAAYLETSAFGPTPILESPCINLGNNSGARLIYQYHMYGASMGTLIVDVYDGVSWIKVDEVIGQQQTTAQDAWETREVNLNSYAGRRIKIRFRGIRGTSFTSDMAVDCIEIFEPLPRDLEMQDVLAPTAGCEVNDQSRVTVEIYNPGTLNTKPDSATVSFQVDGGQIFTEVLDTIIESEATLVYTFDSTADLNIPGRVYTIKTWVDMIGDQNDLNDTIQAYQVKNFQRTPNYFEDFETFRDALCDQQLGQVVEEGWFASEGEFGWNVQRTTCGKGALVTPSPLTGPNGDHTTGRGIFMYTESVDLNGVNGVEGLEATLESPCIDFTNQSEARMSFWYHKYGANMQKLYLDVFDGTTWLNGVDSIAGQTQTSASDPWKVRHVNLDAFAGDLVQVRFRGVRNSFTPERNDMAIDDIIIYEPIDKDIGINEALAPNGDACNLGLDSVKVVVENFGLTAVAANTVEVAYSINGSPRVVDTIPDAIPVGGSVTFRFPGTVDMSTPGDKEVVITARLAGDSLIRNNRFLQRVNNRRFGLPFSFEDFEADGNDGWTRFPTVNYSWNRICGISNCVDGCQQIPPPPIPPNGPSGDHTFATGDQNGDGCYWVIESGFKSGVYPDARLNFPCGSVDFSNSQNDSITLSFWYHRFGDAQNMGDLFVDVNNGTQWINGVFVIRGVQQGDDADPWLQAAVDLNQFAGVANGNIRFRAKFKGIGGNMAIDDVRLFDRPTNDVELSRITRPTSDCGLSNQEQIRLRGYNRGTVDIVQLNACWQITFTPLGGDPVVGPVQCDSLVGQTISPTRGNNPEFLWDIGTRIDMVQPGTYSIKIWADQDGDEYAFNDTITEVIINETRPFPYCTDFSEWTYGWLAKNFAGGRLPTRWTGNQEAYTWKPWLETPTLGHTRGPNDIYLLADDGDGMPGQIAQIASPCFDLTNTPTANLEFWFKAPMDFYFMFLDVRVGNNPWQEAVDTLYGRVAGENVSNWTKYRFSMADFVGDFVQIRFRSINRGGYYAIDDLCMVEPTPQQIELERITIPPQGFCQYLANEVAVFRVQNTGLRGIDSFRLVLAVDTSSIQNPPGGFFPPGSNPTNGYFRDTVWLYRGIDYANFEPGDKIDYPVRAFPIDMVQKPLYYYFYGHAFLPGDPDTTDNFVELYEIYHPPAEPLPYITDFENPVDRFNGYQAFQSNPLGYGFAIRQGADINTQLTGPSDDHTLQNGTGHYFVTNATAGDPGEIVVLQSQCIDLSQCTNPELSYWYHRFGFAMGELLVQVNDDFGWDNVDQLLGQNQLRANDPWQNRIIDLSAYGNDFIRLRFISTRGSLGGGFASHCAIDDIAVYCLPPLDLATDSLCTPTEDSSSCYLPNQTVDLRLRNNGGDSIDFRLDTVNLQVNIFRSGVPWDTLYRTLNTNEWLDPDNDVNRPLPPDSSVCIQFDGTFDMYHIGETFTFDVKLNTPNDAVSANDSDSYDVFTRELGGNISTVVFPNDTVCSGEQVALTLTNYFGRLSWQERVVQANDTGFWLPGSSPPTNQRRYVTSVDTLTYYRVWVCNNVFSTVDSIVGIRPFAIDTVRAFKCAGDPNDLIVNVNLPNNIEKIFLYKENVRRIFFDQNIFDEAEQQLVRDFWADSLTNAGIVLNNVDGFDAVNSQASFTYTNPLSTRRDTTFTDTFWLETFRIDCYSIINIPVLITVEPSPRFGNLNGTDPDFIQVLQVDTLCEDSLADAFVLNAGSREGFQFTYKWEIKQYDLNNQLISTDSAFTQTLTVDPWNLEKNRTYTYQVVVNTENDCGGDSSLLITRFIDDKCFVGLAERNLSDKVDIYPNPTTDDIFIRYRVAEELEGNITIRDLSGKVVIERVNVRLNEKIEKIQMDQLPKGVYFLQIDTDKGRLIEKIVKS